MAVSNSDALQIYTKFFRGLELKGSEPRKYFFRVSELTQQSVADLHRDLYRAGSEITRQEILSFIDQRVDDIPTAFLHLPLKYIVVGEVFEITQRVGNNRPYKVLGIKLSNSHYLIFGKDEAIDGLNGVVTLNDESVFAELSSSPITKNAEVMAISILPPPSFYRNLDYIVLDERYSETLPSSILPLYSKLMDAHVADKINMEWQEILNLASSSGVSTYTVFTIMNYLANNF